MSNQIPHTEPRISLAAVREMDQLARLFRRRLRDVAVELLGENGCSTPISPETILEAAPLVYREMLSNPGTCFGEERGSDGRTHEAA